MARGIKLDLFIGADIKEGWAEVEDAEPLSHAKVLEPAKHALVFKKERRSGKVVTITGPFHMPKDACEKTLKTLKGKLACGGTLKDEWMEFQGDIEPKLKTELKSLGFRTKIV